MIFDSHAHYEDEKFDSDRIELLSGMREKGIGTVINVGSTIETSAKSIALAEMYEDVYAAIGVHPSEIECLNEKGMEWLRDRSAHPKVAAIGEIGLDYYWYKDPDVRLRQQCWFRRQLQLAAEVKLPAIIHSRDAAEDTMKILREFYGQHPEITTPGVMHCYSYSPEIAEELIAKGWYIGVGGVVTFKNARKLVETVKRIPMERILSETDCPYMAPEPYRGKRNSSYYLPEILKKIAEIKGIAPEEAERITEENARRMYGIADGKAEENPGNTEEEKDERL